MASLVLIISFVQASFIIYFVFRLTISVTKSAKAGIVMPVGRVRNQLKDGLYAKRIGTGAAGE